MTAAAAWCRRARRAETRGARVRGPLNLRVYGVLLRGADALIAAECVGGRSVLKLPGGAVEAGETPEGALRREFAEEGGLTVEPARLLHAPGTLHSPWLHGPYTPLYYEVRGAGAPVVPPEEPVELRFMEPETAIASGRMAAPEIVALNRALDGRREDG